MKNGTKMSHFGFELQNHTTIKIVQFGEVFFAFVILKWNSRFRPTFWKEQKRAKLDGGQLPHSVKCAIPW